MTHTTTINLVRITDPVRIRVRVAMFTARIQTSLIANALADELGMPVFHDLMNNCIGPLWTHALKYREDVAFCRHHIAQRIRDERLWLASRGLPRCKTFMPRPRA